MNDETEISINDLFKILLKSWKLIVFNFTLFSILSILYTLSIYNEYRAGSTLIPNTLIDSSGVGSSSGLGGLASIAGIGNGSGSSNEVILAKEIMQSQEFIKNFVRKNNILIETIAVKGWDSKSNRLVIDNKIFDEDKKIWIKGEPSDFGIFEEFSQRINISEDKKTSIVSISIEYYSPQIAKKWVELYVAEINEHMRKRKLLITNRNLESLEFAIQKPSSQVTNESLSRLIYEQQRTKMLAEATPEYVFETINPPVLPEKKSKPSRAIVVIISAFTGAFLSIFWALCKNLYLNNKRH
tara:strand:+ start:65 stop:958 length:894 start_codon:yes stop_codon:yes gene_type:complete